MNLEVINCGADGIRLSGGGRQTRDAVLQNLRVSGNQRGLTVMYAMTILGNISAGPVSHYGDATESMAVEISAGVRDGLQISNLLEF